MARHTNGRVDYFDGLDLLTTSSQVMTTPLVCTGDTSAASALIARMAAQLWNEYPQLWPESVRALIAHSADWTHAMESLVGGVTSKTDATRLLRLCGYGVPSYEKVTWSANNSLTLIVQDELRPFKKNEKGTIVTDQMHLHELPWPKEALEGLGEVPIELRVTLSYLVELSPGRWAGQQNTPTPRTVCDLRL